MFGHRQLSTLPITTMEQFKDRVIGITETNMGGDYSAAAGSIKALPNKTISVPYQGTQVTLKPTDHAATQLYQRLGQGVKGYGDKGLPAAYFTAIPGELWADNMNNAIIGMGEKANPWFLRGNDKGELRAAFTSRYKKFDGRDVIELAENTVNTIAQQIGSHVHLRNVRSGPDFTGADFMFDGKLLQLPQTPDAYEAGFHLSTEETGRGVLSMHAAIYRINCENSYHPVGFGMKLKKFFGKGTIWGLLQDMLEGLKAVVPQTIIAISKAEEIPIPDIRDVLKGFCITNSIPGDLWEQAIEGIEKKHSLAGLVHGITDASKFAEDPMMAQHMQEAAVNALFNVKQDSMKVKVVNDYGKPVVAQYTYVDMDPEQLQRRISGWRRTAEQKELTTAGPAFNEDV